MSDLARAIRTADIVNGLLKELGDSNNSLSKKYEIHNSLIINTGNAEFLKVHEFVENYKDMMNEMGERIKDLTNRGMILKTYAFPHSDIKEGRGEDADTSLTLRYHFGFRNNDLIEMTGGSETQEIKLKNHRNNVMIAWHNAPWAIENDAEAAKDLNVLRYIAANNMLKAGLNKNLEDMVGLHLETEERVAFAHAFAICLIGKKNCIEAIKALDADWPTEWQDIPGLKKLDMTLDERLEEFVHKNPFVGAVTKLFEEKKKQFKPGEKAWTGCISLRDMQNVFGQLEESPTSKVAQFVTATSASLSTILNPSKWGADFSKRGTVHSMIESLSMADGQMLNDFARHLELAVTKNKFINYYSDVKINELATEYFLNAKMNNFKNNLGVKQEALLKTLGELKERVTTGSDGYTQISLYTGKLNHICKCATSYIEKGDDKALLGSMKKFMKLEMDVKKDFNILQHEGISSAGDELEKFLKSVRNCRSNAIAA